MFIITFRLWYWTMFSTRYRLELTDICCRIISNDTVTLEERIWMKKICDVNHHAKSLAESLLCPDKIEDRA